MGEALLVLNGKKADRPEIRQAVNTLRDAGHQLDIRVTWEAGDIRRYIDEACARNIERVIIGGGDGSINEAANAINQLGLGAKYVGIYAYSRHSPPPNIRVHPNVIVRSTSLSAEKRSVRQADGDRNTRLHLSNVRRIVGRRKLATRSFQIKPLPGPLSGPPLGAVSAFFGES